MSSFTLTQSAKADLRSIARFTEKRWGLRQRNVYIKQFDDAFHMLTETPAIGQNCDFIKEEYLKFPQGSHIIFYTVTIQLNIEIIRILHKNMDINTNFVSS